MGLCGQIFKMCKEGETNTNVIDREIIPSEDNKPNAITVNLVIPSDLNINLHLYIHNTN